MSIFDYDFNSFCHYFFIMIKMSQIGYVLIVLCAAGSFTLGQSSQLKAGQTDKRCLIKLDLSQTIITNENRIGNPEALIDEQVLAGDPANTKNGNPKTRWFPGWGASDHPATVFINLRNPAKLASVYLRDTNDAGLFKVETGTPDHWSTLFIDSLKNYETWNAHAVDITTQYLRFTRLTSGSNVSEIVLYGCMLPDEAPPATITDLRIHQIFNNSIKLIWTSTGDDGKSGECSKYDIRYSTSPIVNEAAFEKATVVEGTPKPRVSGKVQTHLIRELAANTRYYFAMKAIDDEDKTSTLSNSISTATLESSISINRITMDKFIGVNAFIDDPLDKVKVAGFIREYHNWDWDESASKPYAGYPNNKIKWAPSGAGAGSWNFDDYYASVKAAGIELSPVIQGSPKWLQSEASFLFDNKPLDKHGANSDDPNSYRAKAHHLFQFAARYGNTMVKSSNLTLHPGQPIKTGMNLIPYLEDWNEPNKSWLGSRAEFSPQEYAAMASANYDGHAGTMLQGSKTFGIKQADPTMKFVMGGTVGIDLHWIEEIQNWFENNRSDNAFIPDVINVHHYAWKNGKNQQGGAPAKSPEEDDFKGKMKRVVDYRDHHFPNVEVWISEFGWDTNPASPLSAPSIGSNDIQEVQAQWLVRAYLAFAAAGVDRAQMYMLRDVDPASAISFSSCGLTGPKADWTPKKSWYYVYTLKNSLNNMVYLGEETSADTSILIYKFKNISSKSGAYVIWAKTSKNYNLPAFKLQLPKSCQVAKKIELTVGEIHGRESLLEIQGNTIAIPVCERPVIILVDDIGSAF
jgi:hypothetical protein